MNKAVTRPKGNEGWDAVPQEPAAGPLHPFGVAVALRSMREGSPVRFVVTVGDALARDLGWGVGTRLQLEIGRGTMAGWVRVVPNDDGRPLRKVPRSTALCAMLLAGEELEHWQAPRRDAEFMVIESLAAVAIRLPWDLREAAADAADPG